jgi:RNA polymerase sigma-70 factor, ECF subfamily
VASSPRVNVSPLLTNFSPRPVYLDQSADDGAAVKRCLDGEPAAFEVLVGRYQPIMFNVALRMLGNYEDARDAAQNTFVKAFEKLGTYDPERRFFSWIYRILMNECLNLRRRPATEPLVDTETVVSDSSDADTVEAAERKRDVRQAILSLSPAYREVIVLRHFAALSYEQMSEAIGVPTKTVKSRLHTARQQLAGELAVWMHR